MWKGGDENRCAMLLFGSCERRRSGNPTFRLCCKLKVLIEVFFDWSACSCSLWPTCVCRWSHHLRFHDSFLGKYRWYFENLDKLGVLRPTIWSASAVTLVKLTHNIGGYYISRLLVKRRLTTTLCWYAFTWIHLGKLPHESIKISELYLRFSQLSCFNEQFFLIAILGCAEKDKRVKKMLASVALCTSSFSKCFAFFLIFTFTCLCTSSQH